MKNSSCQTHGRVYCKYCLLFPIPSLRTVIEKWFVLYAGGVAGEL